MSTRSSTISHGEFSRGRYRDGSNLEARWLFLLEAVSNAQPLTIPPLLVSDSGVENVNGQVSEIIESGVLKRVLALTKISFSNSLIEAWWRALKHPWLYLNSLDTVSSLKRCVQFYVDEHNTRLPH